jgi:hypothetical protein
LVPLFRKFDVEKSTKIDENGKSYEERLKELKTAYNKPKRPIFLGIVAAFEP